MLMEIYCRFTIIDHTTLSFLSLKCVYIFLAGPVFQCMLEQTDAIMNKVLQTVTFVLACPTVYIMTILPHSTTNIAHTM